MKLEFVKVTGRWFYDIPCAYERVMDMQMVDGADTMLDELVVKSIVYGNKKAITLNICEEGETPEVILNKISEDELGAYYNVVSDIYKLKTDKIWLCSVCKEVFGEYPESIDFKVDGSIFQLTSKVFDKTIGSSLVSVEPKELITKDEEPVHGCPYNCMRDKYGNNTCNKRECKTTIKVYTSGTKIHSFTKGWLMVVNGWEERANCGRIVSQYEERVPFEEYLNNKEKYDEVINNHKVLNEQIFQEFKHLLEMTNKNKELNTPYNQIKFIDTEKSTKND